ncbi:hypothetical protein RRSWK_04562 [Rhodopirellula sp. SWK7]|nr:hypothetical protein RRSWK_04562 [Rhodopirellula sp. SWK7]
MLTGTDKTFDQRLCKTCSQSNTLPPLQPATGDSVIADQAK